MTASQNAAQASGTSRQAASARARAWPRPDDVQTSNQASASSSVPKALLSKHGYTAHNAPPGARPVQLRMFYLPDEPAEDG
ncbi:MAG TPA: hypothetical protein VMI33_27890 [Streptosporangiaceae bacterium]|nr:hypothetical protein [Streptosporangiaceae bacterium]